MRSRPRVRFQKNWMDPLRIHPASGGQQVILTLPDLPDRTIQQCHAFLRELLFNFEDHYDQQLARAYGWAPAMPEDDREDLNEEGDDDDDWKGPRGPNDF